MATDTLHTRLLAAVQQRMDAARAANSLPTDSWQYMIDVCIEGMSDADSAHARANDPATVLRHCERDLGVLERHHPIDGGTACGYCLRDSVGWPCDDVVDLATAYGVNVDG